MFCEKCGAKLKVGDMFCESCGAKISTTATTPANQNAFTAPVKPTYNPSPATNIPIKKKMPNKTKWLLGGISIVLVIAVIIGAVILNDKDDNGIPTNSDETSSGQKEETKSPPATNEQKEEAKFPPKTDAYDKILGYGGEYFVVTKHTETYNDVYDEYGVVDIKNNWLHPLSKTGAIADMVARFNDHGYARSYYELEYTYLNEGMFSVATIYRVINDDGTYTQHKYYGMGQQGSMFFLYNAESNRLIESGGESMVTKFHDGFCLMLPDNINDQLLYKVSKNGEKTALRPASGKTIGPVSEGMFFNGAFFYNLDGEIKIDLSEYRVIGKSYYFVDGKCEIYFLNPANKSYMMTIDKNGKVITEPTEKGTSSYNSRDVFERDKEFKISFDDYDWIADRLHKTEEQARKGAAIYWDTTPSEKFTWELFFHTDYVPNIVYLDDTYLGSNERYITLELEKGKEYLLEFRGKAESWYVLLRVYPNPNN